MAKIDISFAVTKGNGTLAATLKIKQFTSPGTKPAPWEPVKLKNGKGSKKLLTATTYDLGYAFMGEPAGTILIVATDPGDTKLLEKKDSIPDNDLSREDTCALVIP